MPDQVQLIDGGIEPVLEPNPEVSLPITGTSEWEHPDILTRKWLVSEIHEALTNAGFTPYEYDDSMVEPCECVGRTVEETVDDETIYMVADEPDPDCQCNGAGEHPLILRRSRRWVRGNQALRVPNDLSRVASPYLGACVSALLAESS